MSDNRALDAFGTKLLNIFWALGVHKKNEARYWASTGVLKVTVNGDNLVEQVL